MATSAANRTSTHASDRACRAPDRRMIGRSDTRSRCHAALRPDMLLRDATCGLNSVRLVGCRSSRTPGSIRVSCDLRPQKTRAPSGRADPVAFVIAAMVAPCRRCSISITSACFEPCELGLLACRASPLRCLPAVSTRCGAVFGFDLRLGTRFGLALVDIRRFGIDLAVRLPLEFVVGLFGDMMGFPFGLATTSCAVTTEAPHWRTGRRGRSHEGQSPQRFRNSDAPLAAESQSFLDNVIADFRLI